MNLLKFLFGTGFDGDRSSTKEFVRDSKTHKPVMRDEDKINLGKKDFWWKVQCFFMKLPWLATESKDRLPWEDAKHGMIKHKCKPSLDNKKYEDSGFYPCLHYGCNMLTGKK